MIKSTFVIQPYKVGSKIGNSLAVVIPSMIVKQQHIDTSTFFVVRSECSEIILEKIDVLNKKLMPADESFHASSQQTSDVDH